MNASRFARGCAVLCLLACAHVARAVVLDQSTNFIGGGVAPSPGGLAGGSSGNWSFGLYDGPALSRVTVTTTVSISASAYEYNPFFIPFMPIVVDVGFTVANTLQVITKGPGQQMFRDLVHPGAVHFGEGPDITLQPGQYAFFDGKHTLEVTHIYTSLDSLAFFTGAGTATLNQNVGTTALLGWGGAATTFTGSMRVQYNAPEAGAAVALLALALGSMFAVQRRRSSAGARLGA